ncbi:MAG: dolichyl-phosphate-mannose-protein mannosyltransferase, partial [Elusimicrobia bacterium]
ALELFASPAAGLTVERFTAKTGEATARSGAAAARSAGRPELRLPLAAWLLLWAPWLLSPRVMFFYHYTPAVPFLCVLLGWAAEGARNPSLPGALVLPGGRAVSRALMLLAFLWFALFYPLHTAVPLPQGAVKNGFLSLPG